MISRQVDTTLIFKVVLLSCSGSSCEHRWSIEGWIHSQRRKRLGQDLHINLQFEHCLDLYEDVMLSLDIEMTVEESLSDDEDEDGVPHRSLTPSLNPKMTLD